MQQLVAAYRAAFPDIHLECEGLIADGNRVAAHASVRGTHLGDLMGMPPTGKTVNISAIEIFRMAEGKIA